MKQQFWRNDLIVLLYMNKFFLHIFSQLYVVVVLVSIFFISYISASSIGFSLTVRSMPECQNRIDDDWDGYIDYPLDVDCEDENGAESVVDIPVQSWYGSGSGYENIENDITLQPEETLPIDECTWWECPDFIQLDEEELLKIDDTISTDETSQENIILESAPEDTVTPVLDDTTTTTTEKDYIPSNNIITPPVVENPFLENASFTEKPLWTQTINSTPSRESYFFTYVLKFLDIIRTIIEKIFSFVRSFFAFFK